MFATTNQKHDKFWLMLNSNLRHIRKNTYYSGVDLIT